ncbi:MAG: alpha/beta hydrolase, partial [Altererythrobacter sp.]|nr:alpha/beta hydrolase [Altererythrobacter sp.]
MIFDIEAAYAKNEPDLNATVYLDVGGKETRRDGMNHPMVSQFTEFTDLLRSRGYPNLRLKAEIIPEAIHETTFPQGFMRGTQWIFERGDEPN